jgi:hypothetical protein
MINLIVKDSTNNANNQIKQADNETVIKVGKNSKVPEESNEKKVEKNIDAVDKKLVDLRVGNALSKANKNIAQEIRDKWPNIQDLSFDEKFGNMARLLRTDIKPVAASDKYVVLKSEMAGLADQINRDLITVEKILEIVFNNKYKAICVSSSEWNNYTLRYKNDKNSFIYTEEENNENKSLKEKAKELFED